MAGVIFFGGFFPPSLLERVNAESRGRILFSNHNFEMSLIGGLSRHDIPLRIVTAPKVYSWPHNNSALRTPAERFLIKGCEARSAGFCNIAVLNKPWLMLSTARLLASAIRHTSGREVWIVQNTPGFWTCLALRIASLATRKRIVTCLVTPDIPQVMASMGGRRRGLKSRIVGMLDGLTMRMASGYGCHVLLTEAMTEYLRNPGPHIVMEGVIDVPDTPGAAPAPAPRRETILYTGSLRGEFGVMNLVDAFLAGEFTDAELVICGSGDKSAEIEALAAKNPSLRFLGLVDSATARRLQGEATILVNPRTSAGDFTRYSFPSKTIEYLLAGKSAVINRLPGIPEEYYRYVYTPADESVAALTRCLRDVMATPPEERAARARAGREFVVKHKNAFSQTGRILDLIKSVARR